MDIGQRLEFKSHHNEGNVLEFTQSCHRISHMQYQNNAITTEPKREIGKQVRVFLLFVLVHVNFV